MNFKNKLSLIYVTGLRIYILRRVLRQKINTHDCILINKKKTVEFKLTFYFFQHNIKHPTMKVEAVKYKNGSPGPLTPKLHVF